MAKISNLKSPAIAGVVKKKKLKLPWFTTPQEKRGTFQGL